MGDLRSGRQIGFPPTTFGKGGGMDSDDDVVPGGGSGTGAKISDFKEEEEEDVDGAVGGAIGAGK